MSKATAVLAGLFCAGAGVYLLSFSSSGEEANWFETMAHGIGIYFIGKGIFVAAVLWPRYVGGVEATPAIINVERPPRDSG